MTWLANALSRYPELAVFLVVGLGCWLGALKVYGIGLGPVTCSLLVGLAVGYFVEVPVAATAKQILFLLFLFSIGFSVGPRFFSTMKGDGLRWVALAVAMALVGLATATFVARYLGLDAGFAGGLLSGALTQSAAMGTASEAIRTLPIAPAEQDRLVAHVAVADALCYVYGTLGVILFVSQVAPRLLRLDLVAEALKVEKELGIDRSKPGVVSAWRPFEMRAYCLSEEGKIVGQTVGTTEALVPEARLFIERIRRGSALIVPEPSTVLQAGDVVVASGRRSLLVETLGRAPATEVEDHELLDIPVANYDIYVTDKRVIGRTLQDIVAGAVDVRGVFLREIVRGGVAIPIAPNTVLQRGDVVRVTGPEPAVLRAQRYVGPVVLPSTSTDLFVLGLCIVAGGLIGIGVVLPLGSLRIALGTSVGTLIVGLLAGYVHSRHPVFGRIPDAALSLMTSLGLAAFVGMVGIGAGPHFLGALRDAGLQLFVGGVVVTTLPLVFGLYFGRYVLKLNPLLLLGGIAGAQTMTAGMAAVQERSGSSVPVLGYSGTVAIGHILLTTWGTIIVRLVT
jgi:putative transport protein